MLFFFRKSSIAIESALMDNGESELSKNNKGRMKGIFAGRGRVFPRPNKPILITAERLLERSKRRKKAKKVTIQESNSRGQNSIFRIRDWQDKSVQRWLQIMVLPMTYEMWAFPYRLALCIPSTSNYIWICDLACDSFFWFDIFVTLTTNITATIEQEESVSKFNGILRNFFFYKFPFELVPSFAYLLATPVCSSVLPSSCSINFLISTSHAVDIANGELHLQLCLKESPIWIWWASTVLRTAPRMLRLNEYLKAMETNLDVSISTLQLFKYSMIIFMTAHWIGCIYFFIARLQNLNGSTWVGRMVTILPLYDCFTAPVATQYVLCLYRGLSALTLSYASSIPNNVWEILFTFFVIVIQIWQVGVILGAIINYTVERDPIAEAHKKLMEDLQLFIESKELPSELTERIYRHFEFQHRKAIENQSSRIDLPKSLEIKVANSKFRLVMDRCTARGQVFHMCNPQFLNMLLTKLRVVFLMPNEEVFKKGDMARELCFVYRGACAIMNDEKVKRVVRHDAPDSSSIVGEIPFFFGVLHGLHCRADADGEVQLLVLSKADGDELFFNYPEQLEIIRANILAAMSLESDGGGQKVQDLGGDNDPDDQAISDAVCEALKSNADETFTALTYAARSGDVEEMQSLIRKGANINHVDYDGRGALAMAAVEGNFKVVELLLQEGVDKNCKNRWGQTPLQEAIGARQGPVVELLLQWKAQINAEQNSGALCSAASTGDLDQLKRLVENKADVNHGDYDRRMPLHLAAAEGHDKIAEFLLDQKADPCALDRWGCTPLQEAVRCGRSLLAELIRTKGGTLPADVGAIQICAAAGKGDVPQLHLLHLCGVKSDVGDYDFRCPLHLAAAEARILAVSFLLVISANPNCTDRWGNTPLDDAYRGGTMYHKFCARLLIAWGGTLGKVMQATSAGQAFVREVEEISMEEVRRLIRRLIDAGYDRRVPSAHSDQEIHTLYEATVKEVVVARLLGEHLEEASAFLRQQSQDFRNLFERIHESLLPVCAAIDSHPVNQRRQSTIAMPDYMATGRRGSGLLSSPLTAAAVAAPNALESDLKALVTRVVDVRVDDVEDAPQALDSDEEAQLHAELDRLVEMQERVEAMGGNQNKYMANIFQRLCLQITDIECMYNDLADVFRQASGTAHPTTVPAVTLREFATVVDMLTMSNISQSDLEEMFEQGLHHISFLVEANADARRGSSGSSSNGSELSTDDDGSPRVSVGRRRRRRPSEQEEDHEAQEDDVRVSMTSIIVGSEVFRQRVMALVVDEGYCMVAESSSLRGLTEAQHRSLAVGGRVRKVAKGEVVFTESARVKARHQSADGPAPPRSVRSPAVRSRRRSSVDVGGEPATFGSWFLIISGGLMVEEDASRPEQKQYSELGPGQVLGGYATLTDASTPFTIRATKGCELLELPLVNLLGLRGDDPALALELAAEMGEAPLSAAASSGGGKAAPRADAERRMTAASAATVDGGVLAETRLQSIKLAFQRIEQVWQEICLGEPAVPMSQFTAFQPYLGEVGSELFRKLFEVKGLPEHITRAIYWEIWSTFLTLEAFGKRWIDDRATSFHGSFSASFKVPATAGAKPGGGGGGGRHGAGEADGGAADGGGLFERWHARWSAARRLKGRFFEEEVVERYETCFVATTGDLGAPLRASRIPALLERLFPDHRYRITRHNCHEFLQAFGRDGAKSKQVTFADMRKVLLERSKGSLAHHDDAVIISGALNPNAPAYARWLFLARALAVFHLAMVPVRLSFRPWAGMLDWRALALDVTADALTLAHVLVLASTAYRNSRAQWVTARGKLLRRVDPLCAAAAVPVDWFAYMFDAPPELCDWLRLPKLLLPYQLLARGLGGAGARRSAAQRMAGLFTGFLALVHLAACAWFYIGSRYRHWVPSGEAMSWAAADAGLENLTFVSYENRYGLRANSTVWDEYLMSLYWVTATVTAYGSIGDLLPQNNVEIIFAMVLMVLSITVYGFLIGEVSTVFMMQDEEVTKARAQLGSVESFVRGSGLDEELRDEIKQHFKAARSHSSLDQAAIFRRMSRSLQVEVSSYTTRGYLDGVPLFAGCSPQLIDAISVLLSEVTFSPEDYLYRISEIAREMFFVIDGAVDEVSETDKGEKVEVTVKAGGSIGVLSFFFGMRHLNSARAGKLAGAVCLRLARDEFLDMLKLYPEDESKIAQSAMKSFEIARSQHGSRRASSHAASVKSGRSSLKSGRSGAASSIAASSALASSDAGANIQPGYDNDRDSSEAFTQALGGSGVRQRMAALKRRRENKRVYGVLTAAGKGDLVRLRTSLTGDGDCNLSDHFRRTPLHVAAAQGQLEAVRFLLQARGDPDARDRFDNTPLHDAVRHRHDAVSALIRERCPGAMLSLKGHEIGGLMCQAAFDGDSDHIKRLIANQASPSACDYDRRSALHLASCEGHLDMARMLLEARADPHARDRFGGSPLDDAVRHGHVPLQALLREHGARLTGEQYAYKICEGAAKGDLETIRTLVTNGVDTSVGDYDGRTALHLAASEGEVSILDYLLAQDPPLDANPVDRVGGTPLEDAVRHGHRVAAMMLEDSGGMRRQERRVTTLVFRYLAHVHPNRIDVVIRARRDNAALRARALRLSAVEHAAAESPEARALDAVRDLLLPNLRASVQRLHDQLDLLAACIRAAAPILVAALKMQAGGPSGPGGAATIVRRVLAAEGAMGSAGGGGPSASPLSMVVVAAPSQAGRRGPRATAGSSMNVEEMAGEIANLMPMAAAVRLLEMLPDLSAAVGPAREVIDAPLPVGCRLVQMLGREFRRDAAALRGEARRVANAARLIKRILRAAQTVFRTRTFRNIVRRSITAHTIVRTLASVHTGSPPPAPGPVSPAAVVASGSRPNITTSSGRLHIPLSSAANREGEFEETGSVAGDLVSMSQRGKRGSWAALHNGGRAGATPSVPAGADDKIAAAAPTALLAVDGDDEATELVSTVTTVMAFHHAGGDDEQAAKGPSLPPASAPPQPSQRGRGIGGGVVIMTRGGAVTARRGGYVGARGRPDPLLI